MQNSWIIAQTNDIITSTTRGTQETMTETAQPSDPNQGQKTQGKPGWQPFIPMILIFVVMYLFMFRGPKKKQQKHKQMVSSLEKNDRIRTIGGIIGTVVDVKDDEITLKIDESNNTKIKITASAVGKNLTKDQG